MSWYNYFNSRASVRNFGDNCFFPDSDFKRMYRSHFDRSFDMGIFSYNSQNCCHGGCVGGGYMAGGWKTGIWMAVGLMAGDFIRNAGLSLACWATGGYAGGGAYAPSQQSGVTSGNGDTGSVGTTRSGGRTRRSRKSDNDETRAERRQRRAEAKANEGNDGKKIKWLDKDQAPLKELQDKINKLGANPTKEELLAIQKELDEYKIIDGRYRGANKAWLEGMKRSITDALAKCDPTGDEKTPEQIAAEQAAAEAAEAAAEAERLAAEQAAAKAAEEAAAEAARQAAGATANTGDGSPRAQLLGTGKRPELEIGNINSPTPLMDNLDDTIKEQLAATGLNNSDIEMLLTAGLSGEKICSIVNDFDIKTPREILFINEYNVKVIDIEGKNGTQKAISLPSTIDKTTLNKLIEISETTGMPIACANNPSADVDKWIAGSINKKSINEENGKLSWDINCSDVGKYGYSYYVTQGDGNKYTVTVTSDVGNDNRKGTAREFELKDGLLRRNDKEETVQKQ